MKANFSQGLCPEYNPYIDGPPRILSWRNPRFMGINGYTALDRARIDTAVLESQDDEWP